MFAVKAAPQSPCVWHKTSRFNPNATALNLSIFPHSSRRTLWSTRVVDSSPDSSFGRDIGSGIAAATVAVSESVANNNDSKAPSEDCEWEWLAVEPQTMCKENAWFSYRPISGGCGVDNSAAVINQIIRNAFELFLKNIREESESQLLPVSPTDYEVGRTIGELQKSAELLLEGMLMGRTMTSSPELRELAKTAAKRVQERQQAIDRGEYDIVLWADRLADDTRDAME